jgi:hypothetical protein
MVRGDLDRGTISYAVAVDVARSRDLADVCVRLAGVLRARTLLGGGGAGRLIEVRPTPGDAERLAELEEELRLPPLYVEFLRRHASEAYAADLVLAWRGVALCLLGGDRIDDIQGSYASDGWPEDWVVIGLEYEGCYFIDVGTGAVGYLDHGVGLRYQDAGSDFVEFLEQVITRSCPPAESELHAAVAAHDLARVEAIAGAGGGGEAEAEARELTLLGAAVLYGAGGIVGWLLDRGAETEAVSPAAGCTALGIAVGTGQRELVLRLLEHGADPEARDDAGRTVLMWATARGDEEVIAAALRAGASPLPEGWTPESAAAGPGAAEEPRAPVTGATPTQGRSWDIPTEFYAVGIGVVIALVIVVIALLIDLLG